MQNRPEGRLSNVQIRTWRSHCTLPMSFCLRNPAPYDAFEHLWRSIFPFDAREKLMVMLTVYADESGTDGRSPIVAVGGYVSEVPQWDDFQKAWNEMPWPRNYQISNLSARRRRVAEVLAAKMSSRSIRCCGWVSFSQLAFATELFVRRSFNSSGRSSEARQIVSCTSSPVSSLAFLQSGCGRSIHQHFRSSHRFKLRRPRSVSLIVPSTVAVPVSFQGSIL